MGLRMVGEVRSGMYIRKEKVPCVEKDSRQCVHKGFVRKILNITSDMAKTIVVMGATGLQVLFLR
jgi:hypothetical protein